MNKVKAVFFDFDWTLFNHKTRTFTPTTLTAIKKIKKQGIKVFINSARSYYSLAGLNTFNLIKFDGYVVSNGAAAFTNNELLYAHFMDKKDVDEIISIARKHRIAYLILTLKGSYIETFEDKEPLNSFYSVFYEPRAMDIKLYNGKDQVLAMQLFYRNDKDEAFSHLNSKLFLDRFFETCVEITSCHFKKSEGIIALIKHENLFADECAAFGDDMNDIDMFNLVKYGICMGNGKEEAKKHAKFVTSNIEDDGILNGLKYLGLINDEQK